MTTITAPSRTSSIAPASFAEVDSVLGFRPQNSLTLRVRRRRRPIAVLRIDLPPGVFSGEHGDFLRRHLAETVTGMIARVDGAIDVELMVYSPPPRRESRRSVSALAEAVAARLDAAGFTVQHAFWVNAGQWAELRHGVTRVRWQAMPPVSGCAVPAANTPPGAAARGSRAAPPAGSVAERAASRAAPQSDVARATDSRASDAGPHSDHAARTPADPHHGPFVPVVPASPERRTRALASLAGLRRPGRKGRDEEPIEHLLDWYIALHFESIVPADVRAIELAWSLRNKPLRDAVLMLCAWGLDAGLAALHESRDPEVCRGQRRGVVLAGFLGEGETAPDHAVLRRSVELLRWVVECVPEPIAGAPLTMLAWLEWARGRGTAARAYLDECARVDPDYELAALFGARLARGHLPEWAVAETAAACRTVSAR